MSVTAGIGDRPGRVAAAAYETAYRLTVPPPVIAENRAELMTLTRPASWGKTRRRSRPIGRPHTAECGANAEAMYGYAATAATATRRLLPFGRLITNPGGAP